MPRWKRGRLPFCCPFLRKRRQSQNAGKGCGGLRPGLCKKSAAAVSWGAWAPRCSARRHQLGGSGWARRHALEKHNLFWKKRWSFSEAIMRVRVAPLLEIYINIFQRSFYDLLLVFFKKTAPTKHVQKRYQKDVKKITESRCFRSKRSSGRFCVWNARKR